MSNYPITLFSIASLLLISGTFANGTVWRVDDDGPADFGDIQDAIDAASQHDTILIHPGSYSAFSIDNKALYLTREGDQSPIIDGLVTITNLAVQRPVSLSGLSLSGGLWIVDCLDQVMLSDCICQIPGLMYPSLSQAHRVQACTDVVFSRCVLTGRHGGTDGVWLGGWNGYNGELGLTIWNSSVALYGCTLIGGNPGSSECSYGFGCNCCGYSSSQIGGDGIRAIDGSQLYLDDVWAIPGGGGVPINLQSGSLLTQADDPVLTMGNPPVVRENQQLAIQVSGPVGAFAFLLWKEHPDWRDFGAMVGVLHLSSQNLHLIPLGIIPGSGTLEVNLNPPPIVNGADASHLLVQVFAISASHGRLLGTPSSIEVLDPAF